MRVPAHLSRLLDLQHGKSVGQAESWSVEQTCRFAQMMEVCLTRDVGDWHTNVIEVYWTSAADRNNPTAMNDLQYLTIPTQQLIKL